ncbi:hypothetical protein [Nocardia brasiliensis]|uniref:hypothetical protein n=1 Tax=Nocardia brasiliensis TaxID=37326 RepID=UPI002458A0B5|nr:hypothetical protein [Nocardia brasiliensis]
MIDVVAEVGMQRVIDRIADLHARGWHRAAVQIEDELFDRDRVETTEPQWANQVRALAQDLIDDPADQSVAHELIDVLAHRSGASHEVAARQSWSRAKRT